MMRLLRNNELIYLQFPSLVALAGVFHGIFLRSAFNGSRQKRRFNLGLGCGDPQPRVEANRRQMRAAFGQGPVVFAHQVHGAQVATWSQSDAYHAPAADQPIYLKGDALVTNLPAHALVIQVADCQPVMLVDPVQGVVANVHSGWRGSIQNVIGRTVTTMTTQFGCRPEDVRCGIGPSLGPCCAEFIHYREEIPQALWGYRRCGDLFDFWQLSTDQLVAAGVRRENIAVSGMCTQCNPHLFFTYRGERQTGRFAAVIGLHPVDEKKG